jgi:hypothetical protein
MEKINRLGLSLSKVSDDVYMNESDAEIIDWLGTIDHPKEIYSTIGSYPITALNNDRELDLFIVNNIHEGENGLSVVYIQGFVENQHNLRYLGLDFEDNQEYYLELWKSIGKQIKIMTEKESLPKIMFGNIDGKTAFCYVN